ncbi:Ankyrin repeat and SAM domain-containing protein 3 [Trichoplax sp. H2]|nr:Ankyrin repeat and SAM domain-containing protein 3 [Trichoplax sp. H2]|eukprot:RDD46091.1 Ankyrin repeat and SAM domain-containing protein 3 [Trichoplax sp. H2]
MDYVMLRESEDGNSEENNWPDLLLNASISLHNNWDKIDPVENPFVPLDLHTASSIGHYEQVRNLTDGQPFDVVNKQNKDHWTPLMYASYMGHDTTLDLLFEAGADPNVKTIHGITALMLAASCGHESIVYALLQQGAAPNDADQCGITSLFYSCRQGNASVVALLLANDADPNIKDPKNGMTPLLEAARSGREVIISTLLKNGADPHIRNKEGSTARSLAVRSGNTVAVKMFDNLLPQRDDSKLTSSDPGVVRSRSSDQIEEISKENANLNTPQDYGIRKGPEEFNRLVRQKSNEKQLPTAGNEIADLEARKTVKFQEDIDVALIQSSDKDVTPTKMNPLPTERAVSSKKEVEILSNSSESDSDIGFFRGGMETVKYDGPLSPSSSSTNLLLKRSDSIPEKQENKQQNTVSRQNSASSRAVSDHDEGVVQFLEQLKLSKYLSTFEEQEIDMETLLTLSEADLISIGIKLLGPRRKISMAISRHSSKRSSKDSGINQNIEKEKSDLESRLQQALDKIKYISNQLQQSNKTNEQLRKHLNEENLRSQQVVRNVKKINEATVKALKRLTAARQTNDIMQKSFRQLELRYREMARALEAKKINSEPDESSSSPLSSNSETSETINNTTDKLLPALSNVNSQLVEELNSVNNMIEIAISNLNKISL